MSMIGGGDEFSRTFLRVMKPDYDGVKCSPWQLYSTPEEETVQQALNEVAVQQKENTRTVVA